MNKKKIISILTCICISTGLLSTTCYAKDDSGTIDLYKVFSNQKDMFKNKVGSSIYKWSMHLPDDAIIFKSEQANIFNMSTSSYKSSIELIVDKNKNNLSLEQLLYQIKNKQNHDYFTNSNTKEFVINICKDENNQKYIRIIKSVKNINFFSLNDDDDETKEYIENRIYIANNYIYNFTINMENDFYKTHKQMFQKLLTSFKPSFDENDKKLKELSDSISTTREYTNNDYGWKITLNPYWTASSSEDLPNGRCQIFSPIYTDNELNDLKKNKNADNEDSYLVKNQISIDLIGSAEKSETSSSWAKKELENLNQNFNKKIYTITKNESKLLNNVKAHHVTIYCTAITKTPYVMDKLYIVENGYKYLITCQLKKDKFDNIKDRQSIENMINSFKLDKKLLNPYMGKIIIPNNLMNINSSTDFKVKKYNFKTKISKNFITNYDEYRTVDSNYCSNFYYKNFMENTLIETSEFTNAYDPVSHISIDMFAQLDTTPLNETIKKRVENILKNNEVNLGLETIKIKSSSYKNAEIYYIENEYNLDKIKKFTSENPNKAYNLDLLYNEYTYIIKLEKDLYVENIIIPISNLTTTNKQKINSILDNTYIDNINIKKSNLTFKNHTLEEFKK